MENNKNANKIFKLFLGSYEGKIFSVDINLDTKKLDSFSFKVSENSIKVITHKDNYIFASGIDEIIHIFDMEKKEEKGMVVTYSGSISNIFISKNFLFAAGDECNLNIWRMSDFNLVHTLKGHKSAVTHFMIHSTGKFALSASKDNSVIVWNLLNGKRITQYKFKNNLICNKILWIKKETNTVLIFEKEFWIFDLFKNSVVYDEWIVKKVKLNLKNFITKIFDAFVVKDKIILIFNTGEIFVYTDIFNNDEYISLTIEKPEKTDEKDLNIRIKLVNVTNSKQYKLMNVVFSNNIIYIYDLNKMLKLQSSQNTEIKKFRSINLQTHERITSINSNILV